MVPHVRLIKKYKKQAWASSSSLPTAATLLPHCPPTSPYSVAGQDPPAWLRPLSYMFAAGQYPLVVVDPRVPRRQTCAAVVALPVGARPARGNPAESLTAPPCTTWATASPLPNLELVSSSSVHRCCSPASSTEGRTQRAASRAGRRSGS
jgi:hypothetical protein